MIMLVLFISRTLEEAAVPGRRVVPVRACPGWSRQDEQQHRRVASPLFISAAVLPPDGVPSAAGNSSRDQQSSRSGEAPAWRSCRSPPAPVAARLRKHQEAGDATHAGRSYHTGISSRNRSQFHSVSDARCANTYVGSQEVSPVLLPFLIAEYCSRLTAQRWGVKSWLAICWINVYAGCNTFRSHYGICETCGYFCEWWFAIYMTLETVAE